VRNAIRLMRMFHTLPKRTAHGVPALAGQTRFRPRSREEWSRLQEATPRRLKPGLHALIKAVMVVQPCVSSFGYKIFGLSAVLAVAFIRTANGQSIQGTEATAGGSVPITNAVSAGSLSPGWHA